MGFLETGVLTTEYLKEQGRYPSEERMKKGPVAVCECVQEIPCNPCESSCPFHAIEIGENISALPCVMEDKCTGCGTCVAACSGLATFVLNKSYSEEVGSVSFPYEYNHSYKVGDHVYGADRSGKKVCEAQIKRIVDIPKYDHTAVVTLEVPIKYVDEVRSIYRERERKEIPAESDYIADDVLVCRCEEITAGEIRKAIAMGARNITGVKLRTRAGMGLCQGRTCEALVQAIIRQELHLDASESGFSTPRTPQRPVTFGTLAGGEENE